MLIVMVPASISKDVFSLVIIVYNSQSETAVTFVPSYSSQSLIGPALVAL